MKRPNVVTRYEIKQIMPAAPGTFALFRDDEGGASPKVWRSPIVAWGVWDEIDEEHGKGMEPREVARRPGCAGPLEVECGALAPCAQTSNFAGVRVGDWWEIDGSYSGFDDPAKGEEEDPSRDVAARHNAKAEGRS